MSVRTINSDLTYNISEIMVRAHARAKGIMSGANLWVKPTTFSSYAECFAKSLSEIWASVRETMLVRRGLRDGRYETISMNSDKGRALSTDGAAAPRHTVAA